MQRAGVFIGVDQTGTLQRLKDAAASARRMHAWALAQGMQDGHSAVLVTDEDGPVTPDRLADAVATVIDTVAPEQLVVYFAGHGVVLRRSEQWLLSAAPERSTHAVDVNQSIEDAGFGAVPHVVLISDACRTAPEGIQAQNVQGGSIFPNTPSAEQRFVDVYYACGLGKPAAEIQDDSEAAGTYRAVFTDVLLDALGGTFHDVFVPLPPDQALYAETRPLRDLLAVQVPARIRAKKLTIRYNQVPQARILSDPGAWLARLDALPAAPAPARPSPPPAAVVAAALEAEPAPEVPVAASARRIARPFGRQGFETGCGLKVRGGRIAEHLLLQGTAETVRGRQTLRIDPGDRPRPASILLRFDTGSVTLLPVLPDFVAGLTFEDDELVSVAYEPSAGSWRREYFDEHAATLRRLRARASAASAYGQFVLEGEDADEVSRHMQYAKGVDPALAVYAAYAFHAGDRRERIQRMSTYLADDVGTTFFDLVLLSRGLVDGAVTPADDVLPCVPLLSQGWSVLRSHRVSVPRALEGVERHARDSVWSLYRADAYPMFAQCLKAGDIR